jgi:predicted transposase YdaD
MGIQEILLHQAKTEGLEQGLEQGLELSNKKSINKMLKNGNSLPEIADFLDISIDEVIRIINKYNLG